MDWKLLFGSAIDLSLETIVNLPTYFIFKKKKKKNKKHE